MKHHSPGSAERRHRCGTLGGRRGRAAVFLENRRKVLFKAEAKNTSVQRDTSNKLILILNKMFKPETE